MDDLKFYKGISQENIKKAIEELKKEGFSIDDWYIRDLEDEFILFYSKKTKTKPPEEDLQKDIHTDVPPMEYPYSPIQKFTNNNPLIYIRDYWFFSIPLIIGIVYYLFIYR